MIRDTSFRDHLVREVMARTGRGEKKSEKAVKAVIDSMKKALRRGEEVELPFGTLVVRKAPPRKQQLMKRHRLEGKKVFVLHVYNKRRRIIALLPKKGFECQ